MNPHTGHLVSDINIVPERQRSDYVAVPEGLNRAARRALRGERETIIAPHSGGQLSRWAAKQRKSKRKAAKASRKRNRS